MSQAFRAVEALEAIEALRGIEERKRGKMLIYSHSMVICRNAASFSGH
jgi:hypothetical protein